jgi:hypothetical protein
VLHLVTNCTARKRTGGVPGVRARDLRQGSTTQRSQQWIDLLQNRSTAVRSASDLYVGEHWSVALAASRRRPSVQLWVVSAGYGLMPADALVTNYDATFSLKTPDSVAATRAGTQEWWQRVNEWSGPSSPTRSSRASLAELTGSGHVLAALSEPYLLALQHDIEQLEPSRFHLISAGCADPAFQHHLLAADGSARMALGGSLISVNIRIADHLIKMVPPGKWSRRKLSLELEQLRSTTPPLPKLDRAPQDDEQILQWIRTARTHDPSLSASRGLRLLRSSGMACEQRRFSTLFRTAAEGRNE